MKKINTFLVFITSLCLFSCSSSPNNEEMVSAIKENFNGRNGINVDRIYPSTGTRMFVMEPINTQMITEVTIDKIGDYNGEGKYWPVKAIFHGRVPSHYVEDNGILNHYGEFRVYYDDFKKLKAEFVDKKLYLID